MWILQKTKNSLTTFRISKKQQFISLLVFAYYNVNIKYIYI